jgi:hypothetical protein
MALSLPMPSTHARYLTRHASSASSPRRLSAFGQVLLGASTSGGVPAFCSWPGCERFVLGQDGDTCAEGHA